MPNDMPKLIAPPGACDCHMHIYDDRFPLAPTATFKPTNAPASAYRKVQRELGIERAVVVQPTGYGFDNRCTLEGMAELGPGTRGIAVVPPDVADAELRRLTDAGMRGVRFHMQPGGVLPWDALEGLAAKVVGFGWHVQLQLDGRELPQHEARLKKLASEVVVDHVGRRGRHGTEHSLNCARDVARRITMKACTFADRFWWSTTSRRSARSSRPTCSARATRPASPPTASPPSMR